MPHFPNRIALPVTVTQARYERKKQLQRSVTWGVSIRLALILCELIGVAFFNSSALFLDALSSLLDVFCSLLLLFFIRLAERPPDRNHPFGHGRYEPLAGLQLALLLVVVGVGMFFFQIFALAQHPAERIINGYVWLIPFGAMVMLEFCYRITMYTAKKQNSPALAADAMHYRIDGVASLFATIALILVVYFPAWGDAIDHTGALLIAGFMVVLGSLAVKDNLNQLIDRIPAARYFESVRKASSSVSGVLETEKIRIQLYGPDAHVDIDVEVDPKLSVERAHKISQKVRIAIQKEWPAVRDVTVHIEPYYPNDHKNVSEGDA